MNPAAVVALALPVASAAALEGVCDALATPGAAKYVLGSLAALDYLEGNPEMEVPPNHQFHSILMDFPISTSQLLG